MELASTADGGSTGRSTVGQWLASEDLLEDAPREMRRHAQRSTMSLEAADRKSIEAKSNNYQGLT